MVWRKWVVRGLVFVALGGFTLAGALYQFLTNPEAVRRQVLARVEAELVGVSASIDSARLRLFGGIAVRELRLARRDDLDRSDFLYVPSAVLYHDKEQLLDGELSIRKVEIQRPRLRAVRGRDGRWNLDGLVGESDPARRAPTVVVRQGTVVIEDRQAAPGTPPIEIKNVHLTAVNDPLSTVTVEGSGTCDLAGAVRIRGRWQRGGPASLTVEVDALRLGPELVRRLAGYCPEAAEHARGLSGKGKLRAALAWGGGPTPALRWSVDGEITEGSFTHPRLPWPLENLKGSFRCADGAVPQAELHATAGPIQVACTLKDLGLDLRPDTPWTELVRELHLTAQNVPVNEELFRRLPEDLRDYQEEFSPSGPVTVQIGYWRRGQGAWSRNVVLKAEGMRARFHDFQYPVSKIRGTLTVATEAPCDPDGEKNLVTVDLAGEAGGRPVFLKGTAQGGKKRLGLNLELWGNDVPVDQALLDALPKKTRRVAHLFRPTGRLDFRAFVRRLSGQSEPATRYLLHLHEGTACYAVFPLPLVDVSGTLDVHPDHWEFRDFVGRHKDGVIRASGRSHPIPPSAGPVRARSTAPVGTEAGSKPAPREERSERISLDIRGQDLPLDEQFRAALAPGRPALAKAWDTFDLTGTMNFAARIDDLPNHAQDIDVTVSVGGCRINPTFFAYPLEDVSATVRYARDSAWVYDFRGRHGDTTVTVKRGRAHFQKGAGFWAEANRLEATRLAVDADLLRALPAPLRKAAETARLSRPLDLDALIVVQQPPEPGAKPTLYWRGTARLEDSAFKTGVDWSGVTGAVSCEGLHNGEQLEGLAGNLHLERATVLGQALRDVRAPLEVWKNSPDILRLPGFRAQLYGGTVGGEGRVEFSSIFRYELLLRASQVRLEEFGRQNFAGRAELSGVATAGLHLWGDGDKLDGLHGNGLIDVPSGKMYRLPLLLDLMKWLGLRLPDRTAFEQARVAFGIEGPRVQIRELDLYGSAVSVRGSGTVNLDGSDLNLDLNADWGRIAQLLPAGINDLSRELSNQLLKIKVRGKVGAVRFEKELVPIVTDPLKRVWNGVFPTSGKKERPSPLTR